MISVGVVWFKKDLRIHDHEALFHAIKRHKFILPVYCYPENFNEQIFNFPKWGSHRRLFLQEALFDLKNRLKQKDLDLLISPLSFSDTVDLLIESYSNVEVYTYEEIHQEELAEVKRVESKVRLHQFGLNTLIKEQDLPFNLSQLPAVFTRFRYKVEAHLKINKPIEIDFSNSQLPEGWETLPSLNLELVCKNQFFEGGETAGLKRVEDYFFQSSAVASYKLTRNGMLDFNDSSKFSPWLAQGCLSPRWIYKRLKDFENGVEKNESTYWLFFELLWRDFFQFTSKKEGTKIFKLEGLQNNLVEFQYSEEKIQAWIEGQTGIPLIDASMRELNLTGYTSNRARQNVASFFVHDLNQDWRIGAAYYESVLIDYDVASNYCNWMYVAGVGNDPRSRKFNIIKQAKQYDADGAFVKNYIPELIDLEPTFCHHPWTRKNDLFQSDVSLNYPSPICLDPLWDKYY